MASISPKKRDRIRKKMLEKAPEIVEALEELEDYVAPYDVDIYKENEKHEYIHDFSYFHAQDSLGSICVILLDRWDACLHQHERLIDPDLFGAWGKFMRWLKTDEPIIPKSTSGLSKFIQPGRHPVKRIKNVASATLSFSAASSPEDDEFLIIPWEFGANVQSGSFSGATSSSQRSLPPGSQGRLQGSGYKRLK